MYLTFSMGTWAVSFQELDQNGIKMGRQNIIKMFICIFCKKEATKYQTGKQFWSIDTISTFPETQFLFANIYMEFPK